MNVEALSRCDTAYGAAVSPRFEFDYSHNMIMLEEEEIRLSPHEADILKILLDNRARPTSMDIMIQRVYGGFEPEAAAVSIRVAMHSLRRKVQKTGIIIRNTPKIGYEIDVTNVPELNRRLSDKILVAINVARASDETEVLQHLQTAFDICERVRRKWLAKMKEGPQLAS